MKLCSMEVEEELEIVGLKLGKVAHEGLENWLKKKKSYVISCMT